MEFVGMAANREVPPSLDGTILSIDVLLSFGETSSYEVKESYVRPL